MNNNNISIDEKYNNTIQLAKLIKGGFLYHYLYNKDSIDQVLALANKYQIKDDDNETDKIFKSFVLFGNMSDTIKYTGYPNKKISDIIFFKQSSNINLTLLAKTLYFISGTKFKDFLQWQIKVILQDNKINIEEEYIKYNSSFDDDNPDLNGI